MDKNMLVLVVIIIILIIGIKVMRSVFKRKKNERTITETGTQFEAHIVGVAHPRAILHIDGQPNQTAEIFGMEVTNTSQARRHENMNRIRVKISYIDPDTKQPLTVHHVLGKLEYEDDRLVKVGNPGLLTLGPNSIAYMKHNKRLYETYVREVQARNITKEQKKHLIQTAALAMNNQTDQYRKDHEGYNVLTPPVIAQGYKLNGEIHFVQNTNTPIFKDWTRELA
jgi:ribosomal protein S25